MKKLLLIVLPLILAVLVFAVFIFVLSRDDGKGALQVTTVPQSKVYLDGKEIGETPLCKCEAQEMLPTGEYTIRIVPQGGEYAPFEEKITIKKSILTVVDRTFGQGATSDGSVITLTPLESDERQELLVLSTPDGAEVYINNTLMGVTPLLLKDITDSDQEMKVKKNGYTEKQLRIRTVAGYKLEAKVFLGVNDDAVSLLPSPTASPSATPAPKTAAIVRILPTPNGFLRVREEGSLTAAELTRVRTGDAFPFISEKNDWYEIELEDGTSGWVSSQYARKEEEE